MYNMNEEANLNYELEKFKVFYNILVRWIKIKQDKLDIKTMFYEHGYKKVIIYGMAELGELLYDEIINSDIEIVCVIDRNPDKVYARVPVYSPSEDIPNADVVVVTAVSAYKEITNKLKEKCSCPMISIEDVVHYVYVLRG